jgi:hypothetical protein
MVTLQTKNETGKQAYDRNHRQTHRALFVNRPQDPARKFSRGCQRRERFRDEHRKSADPADQRKRSSTDVMDHWLMFRRKRAV